MHLIAELVSSGGLEGGLVEKEEDGVSKFVKGFLSEDFEGVAFFVTDCAVCQREGGGEGRREEGWEEKEEEEGGGRWGGKSKIKHALAQ